MVIGDPRHTERSNIIGVRLFIIMKTMRRPGYHQNGFVATHALGQNITQELEKINTFCVAINRLKCKFIRDKNHWLSSSHQENFTDLKDNILVYDMKHSICSPSTSGSNDQSLQKVNHLTVMIFEISQ